MIITKVRLLNWRNFKSAETSLREVSYVLGVNASGKSNFLDVFRFVRDIAKPTGGGLQKAVADRGGLKKVRCLHARTHPEVSLEFEISDSSDSLFPVWKYQIAFTHEGKGAQRTIVKREVVTKLDNSGHELQLVLRPSDNDLADPERLTQTSMEQIQANQEFRDLVEFFSHSTYLHVVPQLLKFGDIIGGRMLENDPFGQAFMERVARTPEKTRASRLGRIEQALKKVIPHLNKLGFFKDEAGRPHLEIRYEHHRPNAGRQLEDQFSDGTLRLIALFWLLLDGNSLLLLEEPELSLNEEIIEQLPYLIASVQRSLKKRQRQIIITTHSKSLLGNAGIDGRGLIMLEPSDEGTSIRGANEAEMLAMKAGLSPAEVVLQKAQRFTKNRMQLDLFP